MTRFLPICLLALGSVAAIAPARAADWMLDPAHSILGFSGTQTGTPFHGKFSRFDGRISFDPAHPEAAHVLVSINTGSAATGDAQRDGAMPGKDWFATTRFPRATFESTGFLSKGPGRWETSGTLTVRGVSQREILPFTLKIDGAGKTATAHAIGRLQLVRSVFGVGQGAWSTGQWVALEVEVELDVAATPTG